MNERNMPAATEGLPAAQGSALVESHRAVAEAIAARKVALANPRNTIRAEELVMVDCGSLELAEEATYDYARGGTDITGASIRLLEVIARRWGNIESGVKELSRSGGYSEVMTYAIDLESGTRDVKTFQVRHWRDKKGGAGYAVTEERDIYEVVANYAARRKRACLEAIIPTDIKEKAIKACERTLKAKVEITPAFISSVVESFEKYSVTEAMIEKRIQRKLTAMGPGHAVQLRRIATSLKEGMSQPADWFEFPGAGAPAEGGEPPRSRSDTLADELEQAAGKKPKEQSPPKDEKKPAAAAAAAPAGAGGADHATGEITHESVRKAIAGASSQDAMTPIMFDIMKLDAGPDRDETMRLWNARVLALKDGSAAAKPAPATAAQPGAKPKGTAKIKAELVEKMNKAKTRDKLDEAADAITLYVWGTDDKTDLEKRYAQCVEDLDL